ncbi:GNAT family N-acetyltransferase [Plantactinospora sp. S1510]|uniref:GNAT family N-acetyltransferase n=2 Tax=Plantactinospora alkalitolerans TaxID=2789879 RepID=A0ABS0GQC3_9ACTN|nr:GNAT family N-acetyltransferase [Plantactinospora alkalitolerans]
MGGPEAVRGLQERAARALPATHVENVDGWWLRSAPGCAWWVRSVLPHGDAGPDELLRRVVGAEQFYADRHTTARFQISAGACPRGLDAVLAERGYRAESPMSLRVAPTAQVLGGTPAGALRIRLDDSPTSGWFDVWHAVHGHHGGDSAAEWDMLARVDGPSAYAGAMVGGKIVAVGRAVADTGWVGLFGMATLPEVRGKGTARSLLAALARWAAGHRADRMYLQVERTNVAALRLYERTGFSEVCGYHYRSAE